MFPTFYYPFPVSAVDFDLYIQLSSSTHHSSPSSHSLLRLNTQLHLSTPSIRVLSHYWYGSGRDFSSRLVCPIVWAFIWRTIPAGFKQYQNQDDQLDHFGQDVDAEWVPSSFSSPPLVFPFLSPLWLSLVLLTILPARESLSSFRTFLLPLIISRHFSTPSWYLNDNRHCKNSPFSFYKSSVRKDIFRRGNRKFIIVNDLRRHITDIFGTSNRPQSSTLDCH